MADKALYILAGYDEITDAHLAAIQQKLYDAGFSGSQTRIFPHITLGSFPTEMEQELVEKLEAVSENTDSFEVTFNHAGIFGGTRVLFIAPDVNHKLLDLKEQFGGSYNWTPHTTMLIDDPEVIFKALPVVMDEFSSFSGSVTKLHLYEFFPARHILSVNLLNHK
ncbi:MAG: 2'-5' RNA ligase family protein [Clostridia bacterium]|nr:2'-5' RNA ligase family protein [Clostridia bacterium]